MTGPKISIREPAFRDSFKRRCMTLETTRRNRPAEVHRSIAVPGTDHPTADLSPKRNGQLKKLIVFVPVKISLPFATRTDDEIEALGNGERIGRYAEYSGLEKPVSPGIHPVRKFARGPENVLAGRKTTRNRSRTRFL